MNPVNRWARRNSTGTASVILSVCLVAQGSRLKILSVTGLVGNDSEFKPPTPQYEILFLYSLNFNSAIEYQNLPNIIKNSLQF